MLRHRTGLAMLLGGALLAAGCGGGASDGPDAAVDGGAVLDSGVARDAGELTPAPRSCAEATPLTDGDRIAVDLLAAAEMQPLLCRDIEAPYVTWFSVSVPAGERLAVQPLNQRDRVFLWLADACADPGVCVERLPPASLASPSPGLAWENRSAETANMILELSSGPSVRTPYELEVRIGPPPDNEQCDGAISLENGETVRADTRLSSPAAPAAGCLPTEFPLYYRVTVPDGESLSVEGAGTVALDCSGGSCPAAWGAFGYAQYDNRSGAEQSVLVVPAGFGARDLTATVDAPHEHAQCASALAVAAEGAITYEAAFGSDEVATLPCYPDALADALYYAVDVPAGQTFVLDSDVQGSALLESCDASACVAMDESTRWPSHRNDDSASRGVIVRVAHPVGLSTPPTEVRLALADDAPNSCAEAEAIAPVPSLYTFHQVPAATEPTDVCGQALHGPVFFRVDVPEGHVLRAGAAGMDGFHGDEHRVVVLEGCAATTCRAGNTVDYPADAATGTGVETDETVVVAVGATGARSEPGLLALSIELFDVR